MIRRGSWALAALVGGAEDLEGVLEDRGGANLGPVEVEAEELVAHLDDTAGVDEEVGAVGDAAGDEPVGGAAITFGHELVVGAAADDAGLEDVDGVVVEGSTEGRAS